MTGTDGDNEGLPQSRKDEFDNKKLSNAKISQCNSSIPTAKWSLVVEGHSSSLQHGNLGHPFFTSNRNLDGRHEEKGYHKCKHWSCKLTKEFNIMSSIINTKFRALLEDMLAMQKSSDFKELWAQWDLKQVNSNGVWPRHCKRDLCKGRLWWRASQIWDLEELNNMKALNHQPENQQWMSNIERKDIKLQHDYEEHWCSKRSSFGVGGC